MWTSCCLALELKKLAKLTWNIIVCCNRTRAKLAPNINFFFDVSVHFDTEIAPTDLTDKMLGLCPAVTCGIISVKVPVQPTTMTLKGTERLDCAGRQELWACLKNF